MADLELMQFGSQISPGSRPHTTASKPGSALGSKQGWVVEGEEKVGTLQDGMVMETVLEITSIALPIDWDAELYSETESAGDNDDFLSQIFPAIAPETLPLDDPSISAVITVDERSLRPGFGSGGLIASPIRGSDGPLRICPPRLRTPCDMNLRRSQISTTFDAAKDDKAWETTDNWQYNVSAKRQLKKYVCPKQQPAISPETLALDDPSISAVITVDERSFRTGFGPGGLIASPMRGSNGTFRICLARLRTPCDMNLRRSQIATTFDAWKDDEAWETTDSWQDNVSTKHQHISFVDNCLEALSSQSSSVNPERQYAIEVFGLLKALHGGSAETSTERLSVWLEQACSSYIRQHVQELHTTMSGWIQTGDEQSPKAWDEAFWWLCARQVPEALTAIRSSKQVTPRLLMTVAAMGGSVRRGSHRLDFLADQILKWSEQKADSLMVPGLWTIYALLSGAQMPMVTSKCPCWQLAFGAHLWYRTGPDEEVGEIESSMRAFEETLRSLPSKHTRCRPQVPHSMQHALGPCDDIRYNLLREFVIGPKQLHEGDESIVGIDSITYSSEPLDAWLGWSVALFLSSIRSDHDVQRYLAKLTMQLVFELEIHGEWSSAIRVARFLADEDIRKRTTISLLPYVNEPDEACKLAPREWVWEAVGLRAAYDQDHVTACEAWLKAGNYERCADAVAEHVLLPVLIDSATREGDLFVTGPATELIHWTRDLLAEIPETEMTTQTRMMLSVLDEIIDGRIGISMESLTGIVPASAWERLC